MALTFELAQVVVRDGDQEALLAERPAMVRALREAFPAALAAWLSRQDDGSWLDVVLWQSRETADVAARRVDEVGEARSWFRHIAKSHGLRHVEVIHEQTVRARARTYLTLDRRRRHHASRATGSSTSAASRASAGSPFHGEASIRVRRFDTIATDETQKQHTPDPVPPSA